MSMGTSDSPPVYEMPTEKAYLIIKLVPPNESAHLLLQEEEKAGEEDTDAGIVAQIIGRLFRRPIGLRTQFLTIIEDFTGAGLLARSALPETCLPRIDPPIMILGKQATTARSPTPAAIAL